ncbi:MAG: hypothetical protein HC884_16690 [Chloroflexaceae bacterium]|nr:hypothetical protein [Chloroflexaceae bacterium]
MHDVFISSLSSLGYELFYILAAYFIMKNGLRRDLLKIELAAFLMAMVFNIIADYTRRVPGSLVSETQLLATFSALDLVMAVIESLALSGLAFVTALLMKYLYKPASVLPPPVTAQVTEAPVPPPPPPRPHGLPLDASQERESPPMIPPIPRPVAHLSSNTHQPSASRPPSPSAPLPGAASTPAGTTGTTIDNHQQHATDEPTVGGVAGNHQHREGFGAVGMYDDEYDAEGEGGSRELPGQANEEEGEEEEGEETYQRDRARRLANDLDA